MKKRKYDYKSVGIDLKINEMGFKNDSYILESYIQCF